LDQITRELGGELRGRHSQLEMIERVCTDSRVASPKTLFIALKGEHTDGHEFVAHAFRNGASAALVSAARVGNTKFEPQWPLVVVPDPLRALQRLAKWHRHEFIGKVLAITGSNGKTIVKDVLKTLLAERPALASPGSYNSQLGLPLAVLSAEKPVPLGILEVGISEPGEMAALEEIAAPNFGILINIGMAHFAAFGSRSAIAREKMSLFSRVPDDGWVLLPANEPTIEEYVLRMRCPTYALGSDVQARSPSPLALTSVSMSEDGQMLRLSASSQNSREILVKTRSPEIITDLHFATSAAYLLGLSIDEIAAGLEGYLPTPTRLELWSSPEGIRIINDGYSSDPISVRASLRAAMLGASPNGRKIFAFAGMRELGAQSKIEHHQVGTYAGECGFNHVFLAGNGNLESTAEGYKAARPEGEVVIVSNPDQLKDQLLPILKSGDTVLFKGPRNAGMVRAVRDLSGSIAQRCLWVELSAIAGNLARLRRHCGGRTHILAMLKALAYGTDLVQMAFWISRLGIHHIGVSSANEGVSARKAGADQEIYVFLADREDVDNLIRYRLTPIIYSAELAETIGAALAGTGHTLNVHLKVDTGMHRMGVNPNEVIDLAKRIKATGTMNLTGICTHFASADDPKADDYTRQQIATFNQTLAALHAEGFHDLQAHAANTAAAVRFPEAHYDMVRIGLGLYGVYPSVAVREALDLELAIGVTSRITSIQEFSSGDALGYNQTYTAKHRLKVGVVPFGYADGLPWGLSGSGHVLIEGQSAPIVGRISMDQIQVDITNVKGAGIGAEVLLYGTHHGHALRPEHIAEKAGTIPHELLARLGKRVHRIFVEP
jgi:alanine racemase